MSKTPPLENYDTIHFKYFVPGFDPNKPDVEPKKLFAPAEIWCRIHGEWFKCPRQDKMRANLTEIRRFLQCGMNMNEISELKKELENYHEMVADLSGRLYLL